MIAAPTRPTEEQSSQWQDEFLKLLPTIKRNARCAFRHLPSEAREEAIAEVVASTTCAYERLHERGEPHRAFGSVLCKFAVAQYHAGRRVGSPTNSRDVCSPSRHCDGETEIQQIGSPRDQRGGWREQLVDNRQTPVPIQAAFRIDFSAWLRTLEKRDRRISLGLARGDRTCDVAQRHDITNGRVSQLRRDLAKSWERFRGDRDFISSLAAGSTEPDRIASRRS